jgi:hypothetical protein
VTGLSKAGVVCGLFNFLDVSPSETSFISLLSQQTSPTKENSWKKICINKLKGQSNCSTEKDMAYFSECRSYYSIHPKPMRVYALMKSEMIVHDKLYHGLSPKPPAARPDYQTTKTIPTPTILAPHSPPSICVSWNMSKANLRFILGDFLIQRCVMVTRIFNRTTDRYPPHRISFHPIR